MPLRRAIVALASVISIGVAAPVLAQAWNPFFGDGGANGMVYSYVVFNGQLYASGAFTFIDGVSANYVARWTGLQWEALPGALQLPNAATALAVYNGTLYAGGLFQAPGEPGCDDSEGGLGCTGVHQGHLLAAYGVDGWHLDPAIAFGIIVRDMEVFSDSFYGTSLYVGGHIASVGTITDSPHLVRYTLGAWSGVGNGVQGAGSPQPSNDGVYDLMTLNNQALTGYNHPVLCVAGTFSFADSIAHVAGTRNIAHWSFEGWHGIGCGVRFNPVSEEVPPSGTSLAFYRNELYLGGSYGFVGCSTTPVNNLAAWNGAMWHSVGVAGQPDGTDSFINSLTVQRTENVLYLGGDFDTAGIISSPKIARWNGTAFSAVGGGMDSAVQKVYARTADVAVGGFFTGGENPNGTFVYSNDAALWVPLLTGP
jgi:hypothetical protein